MSVQAILAIALLASAVATGWYGRDVIADRDTAQALAEQTAAISRRAMRVQETSDAAYLQAQARVAAVRRADATGNGLRVAAEALAAPEPTDQCETAAARLQVFADVLGGVESEGREMARIADERGEAGTACERIAGNQLAP